MDGRDCTMGSKGSAVDMVEMDYAHALQYNLAHLLTRTQLCKHVHTTTTYLQSYMPSFFSISACRFRGKPPSIPSHNISSAISTKRQTDQGRNRPDPGSHPCPSGYRGGCCSAPCLANAGSEYTSAVVASWSREPTAATILRSMSRRAGACTPYRSRSIVSFKLSCVSSHWVDSITVRINTGSDCLHVKDGARCRP